MYSNEESRKPIEYGSDRCYWCWTRQDRNADRRDSISHPRHYTGVPIKRRIFYKWKTLDGWDNGATNDIQLWSIWLRKIKPGIYLNVNGQLFDEDYSPEDVVQYSLFPRISPSAEHCEENDVVLRIQALPHPQFIPFKEEVFLSYGKNLEETLKELSGQLYRPRHFDDCRPKISQVYEKVGTLR